MVGRALRFGKSHSGPKPRNIAMAGTLLILLICAVLGLIAWCGGHNVDGAAARTRCESLRDHLVDLRVANASSLDREAHRAAMVKALGDSFVADCQSKLGAAEVHCALHAPDMTAAAACKPPSK
jgi:hypothetical protein